MRFQADAVQLQDIAERFDRFLPLAADELDGWERAVAHLVTAVGDRTQYESAWYRCCTTVLGWFLEAAGEQVSWRDVVPYLQTPVRALRDGFAAHATIGDH